LALVLSLFAVVKPSFVMVASSVVPASINLSILPSILALSIVVPLGMLPLILDAVGCLVQFLLRLSFFPSLLC
jgi:hypothetical protein